jgi:hypothetical protein
MSRPLHIKTNEELDAERRARLQEADDCIMYQLRRAFERDWTGVPSTINLTRLHFGHGMVNINASSEQLLRFQQEVEEQLRESGATVETFKAVWWVPFGKWTRDRMVIA